MELLGIKENPIKIKRTIFNMDLPVEKTSKISRNIDSGTTQLQQIETLLHTLLRLEAIRADAYERWQPYFNQAKLNFQGLIAYLKVFHGDNQVILSLQTYFSQRQRTLAKLKKDKNNPKLLDRLMKTKNFGNELMEDLREKIYSLQLTAQDFHRTEL